MKLGKQKGSLFDDRIDTEICPSHLADIIELIKGESLAQPDYVKIGYWRTIKDLLQQRYDEWRKLRDEKDEKLKGDETK